MTVDPLSEHVPNHGFRRGTNDQGILQSSVRVGNQTFATYAPGSAAYVVRSAGSAAVVDGQGYGYFNFNARVYKVKLATMETPSYAQLAAMTSNVYESCGDAVLSDDKQYG